MGARALRANILEVGAEHPYQCSAARTARSGLWSDNPSADGRVTWAELFFDLVFVAERFGLFTIILLGESIVAIMKGVQSQPDGRPERRKRARRWPLRTSTSCSAAPSRDR